MVTRVEATCRVGPSGSELLCRRRTRPDDARADDPVETGETPIEVRVAFVEDRLLPAAADSAAGVLAVPALESVGYVHAFDHAAEGREALRVQLPVVAQADEDLSRPAARLGEGESHGAAKVRLPQAGLLVGNRC